MWPRLIGFSLSPNTVLSWTVIGPQTCPQCHVSGCTAHTHGFMLWKPFPGGLQYSSPLIPKPLKICLRDRGTPYKVQSRPKAKYHKISRRATAGIHYLTTGPEEQCTAQFYWAIASVSEFSCMEKEILHPSTKGKPMCRQQGFSWVLYSNPTLT